MLSLPKMPKARQSVRRLDALLKDLYYNVNSPAAFSSPRILYLIAKKKHKYITLKDVKNWLYKQDLYTRFRKCVGRFPRRKVLVRGPNIQAQIDLMFMQSIAKENNGYKYILTYIDCFSHWACAIPLKNKIGSHVTKQFELKFIKIFPKRKPK